MLEYIPSTFVPVQIIRAPPWLHANPKTPPKIAAQGRAVPPFKKGVYGLLKRSTTY